MIYGINRSSFFYISIPARMWRRVAYTGPGQANIPTLLPLCPDAFGEKIEAASGPKKRLKCSYQKTV